MSRGPKFAEMAQCRLPLLHVVATPMQQNFPKVLEV